MKEKIKQVAIWVGSIALGKLMGVNVIVPAISGFIAYYLIKKSEHSLSIKFKYPLSYLIGHTAWMVFGYIYMVNASPSNLPDFFLVDVAISVVFVLLLIMVIKKWVYISLYLYEIMSLLINIEALSYATTTQARALLTHIILRLAVIFTLFLALRANDSVTDKSGHV